MIIVLKEANFAQKNIGKVQLAAKLHPFTEAAIKACGNSMMNNKQKFALNDLFVAMGVDGSNDVMSKMRKVYLPIIAGDVSKALVNYADSNSIDKVPASNVILRNNGLVATSQVESMSVTVKSPLKADNFFALMLRTEKMVNGVADTSDSLVLRGVKNNSLFLGIRYMSVSGNTGINLGNYGANWDGYFDKAKDVIKTTAVVNRSSSHDLCVEGTWTNGSGISTTSDMSDEAEQQLYLFGINGVNKTCAHGIAMLGEAITTDQAKAICNACDKLYAAFSS